LTILSQSIEIGDDSYIRYTGAPLFIITCNTDTNSTSGGSESGYPSWYDANHQSFKKVANLMKRRVVAVGDLHSDARMV
jgi:hypothetical protein